MEQVEGRESDRESAHAHLPSPRWLDLLAFLLYRAGSWCAGDAEVQYHHAFVVRKRSRDSVALFPPYVSPLCIDLPRYTALRNLWEGGREGPPMYCTSYTGGGLPSCRAHGRCRSASCTCTVGPASPCATVLRAALPYAVQYTDSVVGSRPALVASPDGASLAPAAPLCQARSQQRSAVAYYRHLPTSSGRP